MLILGLDPGLSNFGCSCIKITGDKYSIKWTHLLKNKINNLTYPGFEKEYIDFKREFVELIKREQLDGVCAERFLTRGRFWGNISENIGIMLGVLKEICAQYKLPFLLITSSQWKNHFNKLKFPRKLDNLYKVLRPYPPHLVDASLIGIYSIRRLRNFDLIDRHFFRREIKRWKRGR